ncbi:MAG: ATP-binding protein [Pseudomonadota bacterium]
MSAEVPKAPYYKFLGRKIALAIAVVAFIPYALTYFVFYSNFQESIRAQVLGSLRQVVQSHQRTIDDFLNERLSDLRYTANLHTIDELSRPADIQVVLNSVNAVYRVYVDLGFLSDQGRHLAYAGPYGLQEADYSQAFWFKEVMAKGVYVSDVFKGVRGVPHFIIAVKVSREGRDYVLRATIDIAQFSSLVEGVRLGKTGEAFILNQEGLYQTQSRSHGNLLSPSDLSMPEYFTGVRVNENLTRRGRSVVVAETWLKYGQWLLICQQDTEDAFSQLAKTLNLAIIIGGFGLLIVTLTTVVFTRYLVGRIAQADREKELLNEQIIQSGKLSSLGELAAGVAHEINNPVAIMIEEAGWVQDLMSDELECFEQSPNRSEYERALKQINTQGQRCKEITHKLLGFARRTDAPVELTQINDLIHEVVELLERPASYANVHITQDLAPNLPQVNASPSELQQVLINLIKNSTDAMEKTGGTISVSTKPAGSMGVILSVKDDGPGIPEAVLPRIFDPFFTTKPVGQGTGLGLSICFGIVSKLGGKIEVISGKDQGTTFLVNLPAMSEAVLAAAGTRFGAGAAGK